MASLPGSCESIDRQGEPLRHVRLLRHDNAHHLFLIGMDIDRPL
jgi:hypothetical protein